MWSYLSSEKRSIANPTMHTNKQLAEASAGAETPFLNNPTLRISIGITFLSYVVLSSTIRMHVYTRIQRCTTHYWQRLRPVLTHLFWTIQRWGLRFTLLYLFLEMHNIWIFKLKIFAADRGRKQSLSCFLFPTRCTYLPTFDIFGFFDIDIATNFWASCFSFSWS